MREYELMAVYDLAVIEAGGPDASVEHLTQNVEKLGGKVLKVDHWGRRRMAYRINKVLDADYVLTRVELDTESITTLSANLQIDEKVYRYLVVRADELPPPRPVPPPPPPPPPPPTDDVASAPVADGEAAADASVVEAETPAVEAEAVAESPAPEAEAPAAEAEVVAEAPAAEMEAPEAEAEVAPEVPAEEPEADPAPSTEESSE